jgi:dihydrofolate synthase / folylpolyglutamate synthase
MRRSAGHSLRRLGFDSARTSRTPRSFLAAFSSASLSAPPTCLVPTNRCLARLFSSTVDNIMGDNVVASSAVGKYSAYEIWVRRLYATNMFHPVKLGLTNIQELHALLGNPVDKVPCVVHIAGTNGKGSVALKIAKTLEYSNPNLTVGLFCSPHVSSFRERMQVNSELISEQEVVDLLPNIYALCKEHDIPATFFEITTALAFAFFGARQADVVVLETGLGGRLDATNVIQAPAISIITSIGLEHTRILGDTIELIALEKGGIIKAGRPVLVGPNVPHDVLRQCASEKHASAYYTCDDVLGVPDDSSKELTLQDYDLENARIATAALKLLQKSHPEVVGRSIPDAVIQRGTSQRPPCRFEIVHGTNSEDAPVVILDVAHNPPAMDYLVRKLHTSYPDASFRLVVGMSSDKDMSLCGASIMDLVKGDASRIHFVEAAHPRAAKLEDILAATALDSAHYDFADRSVTTQIRKAMELMAVATKKDILVVCGSVFLMAEAREALGFDEPRDSPYIAELAGSGVRHAQENFGNSSFSVSTSSA